MHDLSFKALKGSMLLKFSFHIYFYFNYSIVVCFVFICKGVKSVEVDLSSQAVRILGSSPVKTMTDSLEQTERKVIFVLSISQFM